MLRSLIVVVLLGVVAPGIAFAHGAAAGNISVSHAWTRAVVVTGMNGGGYVTIVNSGNEHDRLIAIKTDIAESTELHETVEKDGMMHMQFLPDGIPVPANSTVELKPGGLHLMLLKVKRKTEPGEQIPVTLVFERAGELATHLAVQPISGSEMTHH